MSDNKNSVALSTDYKMILPCSQEQFSEFIAGLLGKPQTLENYRRESFEIRNTDISQIYHLVDQRVSQQNEAHLIQFNVKISYTDGSSVLLGSLAEYEHYNEIHPVIPDGITLSWTYMIKFQKRNVPEKQEIDLTFHAMGPGENDEIETPFFIPRWRSDRIQLRINHTARSWGVDIQSLIMNHVKGYFVQDTKAVKFITTHSGTIGVISGVTLFGATVLIALNRTKVFQDDQRKYLAASLNSLTTTELSAKLDFLVNLTANGVWPRYLLSLSGFLLIGLLISILFGVWVGLIADNPSRSFILLTDKSKDLRKKYLNKRKNGFLSLAIASFGAILLGLASEYIFRWLTS